MHTNIHASTFIYDIRNHRKNETQKSTHWAALREHWELEERKNTPENNNNMIIYLTLVGAQHQHKYNLPFLGWLKNKIAKLLLSAFFFFHLYSFLCCLCWVCCFFALLLLFVTFGIFIVCSSIVFSVFLWTQQKNEKNVVSRAFVLTIRWWFCSSCCYYYHYYCTAAFFVRLNRRKKPCAFNAIVF